MPRSRAINLLKSIASGEKYWLTRRAFKRFMVLDVDYICAQLSLDLCGWKPTHSVMIEVFGKQRRWYKSGKMPRRRLICIDKDNSPFEFSFGMWSDVNAEK